MLKLSPRRADAVARTAAHYAALFSDAPALRQQLAQFFLWTAWAAA